MAVWWPGIITAAWPTQTSGERVDLALLSKHPHRKQNLATCRSRIVRPILGLTPPRCALRGQRCALSKFVPDEFVERGPSPLPPSQKQKARTQVVGSTRG